MEASIHSVDGENRGSAGKTFQVAASEFEIEAANGYLHLCAVETELYLPPVNLLGDGGFPRDTKRTLRLALSPDEIKRLVDAAIAAQLIRVQVAVG